MPVPPEVRAKWLPYYTLMGEVLATWDKLHSGLEYLFMALVDPNTKTAQPKAIFQSARATQTQISMLRNALETSLIQPESRTRVAGLIDAVVLSNKTRNAIVHGTWVMIGYIDTPDNFIAIRLTSLPSVALSNEILKAHVERSNKFQKERAKFLYTPERIAAYVSELDLLLNRVWSEATKIADEWSHDHPEQAEVPSKPPSASDRAE